MRLKSLFITLSPEDRLHNLDIPVVGLTGGIASGKSTVAEFLKEKGLAVISADVLIKNIYKKSEVIDFIKNNFPQAITNGNIDFPTLRKLAFNDDSVREKLEMTLYAHMPDAFIDELKKYEAPEVVVYDVPLLFEKGLFRRVDLSICVYTSKEKQIERMIARDNHDWELASKIIAAQMDLSEKKEKSDFVIENEKSKKELEQSTAELVAQIFEN